MNISLDMLLFLNFRHIIVKTFRTHRERNDVKSVEVVVGAESREKKHSGLVMLSDFL